MKDEALQIKLINQALAAAAASIELSKQLLAELTGTPVPQAGVFKAAESRLAPTPVSSLSLPGTVGVFDGENMTTTDGKKYPVPVNYASKTLLVYGDRLKMIDEGGTKLFKQIERVRRQRIVGTLCQKDNGWYLEAEGSSYKVLEAAVKHFEAKVGDKLVGIVPKDTTRSVPFAALEGPEVPKLETPVPTVVPHELPKEVKRPAPEKSAKMPEVVAEAPLPKVTKVQAKPNAPAAAKPAEPKKLEKAEKKNEPIISEDDLR